MNDEQPRRRRRIEDAPSGSPERMLGAQRQEVERTEEISTEKGLDDDLDPSGRPYRARNGERAGDPRFGEGIGAGWGRVVRSVFRLDEEEAYARVKQAHATRPIAQMEYGELIEELDYASQTVVVASQLAENAKVVERLYETDVEAMRAPMRAQARTAIVQERGAAGAKTITKEDLSAKMVELWPDEWRRQEENLAKAKGMVAYLAELRDRSSSRCRELDGIVRTVRKA